MNLSFFNGERKVITERLMCADENAKNGITGGSYYNNHTQREEKVLITKTSVISTQIEIICLGLVHAHCCSSEQTF